MPLPNQISKWRFLGLASTIIGLLCYALSSSFNYLFGEWNLFKVFLYLAFSIFISFVILFARECQISNSLRLKAHCAFLILTITSVYSFFFDKVVNGKPDAYSLISCAAFAIVSLTMSKQTQCEFGVDLLYFFLGCLIIQLMKIKLLLGIIGACFSYALISLRFSLATPHGEHRVIENEHSVVIEVDPLELASMMQELMNCIKALEESDLNLTDTLSEYLEDYDTELDCNLVMDTLPLETIDNLHEKVKVMMEIGLEKKCSEVYSTCRRKRLEEGVIGNLLGLKVINVEEAHVEDYMIRKWIKAFEVAIRILFPGERDLCYRVFYGFQSIADTCFTEVCRGTTIKMLNFATTVASGGTSKWRLWQILDMFGTLSDLISEFQSLFPMSLVNEAIATRNRLGEASRDVFIELGYLIFRFKMVFVPPNGGLHPVTRYVRSYLVSAYRSRRLLEQILREYPNVVNGRKTCYSFSAQMDFIVERLERKLAVNIKNYKDVALRYFFIMNNLSCIEDMEKEEGLGTVLSDDWFQKTKARVQQNLEFYKKNSWNKVLELLKLDGNELLVANVAADSMKDKLCLFNEKFKEMCSVQSTWFLFDKQLRAQIIVSLENVLLPAYGNFIGRFHDVLGGHAYEYIKFGMFDIQDRLNHLFLGNRKNISNLQELQGLFKIRK
ncbi:exocyst complex component EXO70B1-like [Abrus precatorius]|uniref:Exocyst subunit Exo70 family protein n=1 Tax=Abrus precatorius TaxID=3816 RepID=A0A8B8JPH0_ABRPR|nr:exocyst complex component EXO70B1-like [Abrus precatorius]